MYTLGINAAFHDCSATLVRDGEVLAAAEEERFTRVKHGKRPLPFTTWQLPYHAIDYCLAHAGIALHGRGPCRVFLRSHAAGRRAQPARNHRTPAGTLPRQPRGPDGQSPWDPLFLSYIVNAPRQLIGGAPHHLRKRFEGVTLEQLQNRWQFVEHHLSHEASAFLAAPCDDCAVLTMDGRGERATTSYGHFSNGRYRRLKQIDLPHSLGLLYEDVTEYLGFLRSSDEYKVMALASYGKPEHVDLFRRIVRLDKEGGYVIEPMNLVTRFGPARKYGAPFEQRHSDIAHSLQKVLEETALHMARWLHAQTGARHLSMAGGVALNCVMNARIAAEGPFDSVWVQPAAGDAGTSLGAALWVDYERRESPGRHWTMQHAYLGPEYADEEIERLLDRSRLAYRRLDNVAEEAAELLAREKILGWFQGRMEFGPRALGARSILASPWIPPCRPG